MHGEKIDILGQQLAEIQRLDRAKEYTDLGDLTVAHIAGMVEWRVLNSRHFDCGHCKTVLANEKKIQQSFLNGKQTVKPCQSTFDVCFTAEHFLKLEILKGQFKLSAIQYAIISSLDCESLYAGVDFLGHVDHKLYMIKHILNEYIRIKGTYLAKTHNFKENQLLLHQRLSKLVLHCHQ